MILKRPRTLSFRLTAWYVGIFAVTLLVLFAALYFSIRTILNHQVAEDLAEDVEEFRQYFDSGGLTAVRIEIDREVAQDDPSSVFIRVLDQAGRELHATDMSPWPHIDEVPGLLATGGFDDEPVIHSVRTGDDEHAAKIAVGMLAPGMTLQVGESTEEHEELMEILQVSFLAAYVLILPVASLIGWMVARKAAKGIRVVSETAARIHRGALEQRVPTGFEDAEIQQLAMTFNAMLDRMSALVAEIRQMTDNIAHDMRSPLARIRAVLEDALDGGQDPDAMERAARDTLRECDRLLNMVNATLDLAELEAGLVNGDGESVDLAEMVRDACELFEAVAEQKSIILSFSGAGDCRVRGNPQYLQRLIANLIDNALKYTPAGGDVRLTCKRDGARVLVEVSDTGIGICPEQQAKVFDRFFRGDDSRQLEGCGMGLSFARAIAQAHKGEISLRSREGVGSRFIAVFPAFQ
ncbi:MAG: HAMP domain-containing protein [Proteobacteria bacterium]|nr:MAG: HAMP domain-containing protein [Pseudomonadota bacterium]